MSKNRIKGILLCMPIILFLLYMIGCLCSSIVDFGGFKMLFEMIGKCCVLLVFMAMFGWGWWLCMKG